jgi:hypothetical protein
MIAVEWQREHCPMYCTWLVVGRKMDCLSDLADSVGGRFAFLDVLGSTERGNLSLSAFLGRLGALRQSSFLFFFKIEVGLRLWSKQTWTPEVSLVALTWALSSVDHGGNCKMCFAS